MIFHLDHRCQEILKTILYANGYIKVQDIAEQMHTSKRSTYYDIQKINDWLTSCNIEPLEQERGKGIIVNAVQKEMIQKVISLNVQPEYPDFTPHQRRTIELCMIIAIKRALFVEDFMEVCDVSRNTVLNDLKQVTQWLEKHELRLKYAMKTGYTIEGDPVQKRAFFFLYYPSLASIFNYRVFPEAHQKRIADILNRLKMVEHELHAEYVSGTLSTLATFISILDHQEEIESFKDMDLDEITGTNEYQLVCETFSKLPESEKIYIALHLLGSRLQSVPMQISQNQGASAKLAKEMVEAFEQISGIQYTDADELIRALSAHLKTSMYRYRYGIQLGNPMLENIQSEYPELFELTKQAASMALSRYGMQISDAETAYLTLHFGAFMTPTRQDAKPYRILIVCPNGVGTGNMIKSEVLSLVPQATEVINIPLGKYRPDHGYDVVISTVTLPEEKNQIVVHPILTDQDRVAVLRRCMVSQPQARMEIEEIIKIAAKYIPDERLEAFKKELADRYSGLNIYRAPKKNYGQGLMAYLQPSHIQIINQKTDWQEALEISCRPLLEAGSITERYLEAMIRDQKEKGLYMFLTEGLVLAHSSSENGVNHVDVSLTTFTPAVRFLNQKEARIIITLCAEDQTKHIRILNDIIKIFSKKKNIGQLADLDQIQDVYAMIAEKTEEGE